MTRTIINPSTLHTKRRVEGCMISLFFFHFTTGVATFKRQLFVVYTGNRGNSFN
nr:MAG TPA: hypothetical protein [Caudoviricetes sp.]